jgi:hypothetical protein
MNDTIFLKCNESKYGSERKNRSIFEFFHYQPTVHRLEKKSKSYFENFPYDCIE